MGWGRQVDTILSYSGLLDRALAGSSMPKMCVRGLEAISVKAESLTIMIRRFQYARICFTCFIELSSVTSLSNRMKKSESFWSWPSVQSYSTDWSCLFVCCNVVCICNCAESPDLVQGVIWHTQKKALSGVNHNGRPSIGACRRRLATRLSS